MSAPTQKRYGPALCALNDRSQILLTGGSAEGDYLTSCELYSAKTDRWKPAPVMNHGRHQHASCFLNGRAYVFCGYSRSQTDSITTIERIDIDQASAPNWLVIEIPDSILPARCYPVVAPVSTSQVAILGGYDASDYVSDAIMFDLESEKCEKIMDKDPKLAFYAFGN